ncbi:polysaccharide pyruvyl transferase family protein [Enterococcus casseliflavus]|uniref:polysaccharide pyruvyl transferase family protein n=2 Tax=Enterococcus casseliflavus TaxID=37734 RepID=UPI0029557951|nr:polysaccharide pyruvyl transferase family protein [Enterococcus casseliflavus]MDV7712273.1 polysaccharide pyruvyl transferase family protein [Enterococcus casseliflavus]
MKKVGIMSMQRIYNYGSFLQSYALKRLIELSNENVDVIFVDYEPGEPLIKDDDNDDNRLKRNFNKFKQYNSVNTSIKNKIGFFKHKKNYAKRFFPLLGIEKNRVPAFDIDILVIGSDEVFNCVQSNTNVGFSTDLFGQNTDAQKIISYAASFGNTTLSKIIKYNIQKDLAQYFQSFSSLSLRDENSYNIAKSLGVKNPVVNIDPVLAYDYMNLEKKIPKERLHNRNYMIVYGYSGRLNKYENSLIREFSNNEQLEVICIGGVQDCCDKFIDCDPFELLAYFRDAEYIVTDTFHGTIFSIINKKKFTTLIRRSVGTSYGNEEKLSYLLKTFGLGSRGVQEINENILREQFLKPIDYKNVNNILEIKRKETLIYLKDSI